MIRLLKAEFIKLFANKIFWIFVLVYVLGLWVAGSIAENVTSNIQNTAGKAMGQEIARFDFPMIWEYISYVAKYFNFMPVLFLCFYIGNEYSYKTLRQSIIDGATELNFILIKQIMIIIFTAFCVIFTSAFIIYFGTKGENHGDIWNGSHYIINFAILTLGMMNMSVFFVHLFRSTFLSLLLFSGYFIFFEIIIKALFMKFGLDIDILNYFPQTSIWGLIEIMDNIQFKNEDPEIWQALIWALLFPLFSLLLLKNRDK